MARKKKALNIIPGLESITFVTVVQLAHSRSVTPGQVHKWIKVGRGGLGPPKRDKLTGAHGWPLSELLRLKLIEPLDPNRDRTMRADLGEDERCERRAADPEYLAQVAQDDPLFAVEFAEHLAKVLPQRMERERL